MHTMIAGEQGLRRCARDEAINNQALEHLAGIAVIAARGSLYAS